MTMIFVNCRLDLPARTYIHVIAITETHIFMKAAGNSELERASSCTVRMCVFGFAADSTERRMRGLNIAIWGFLPRKTGRRTIDLN